MDEERRPLLIITDNENDNNHRLEDDDGESEESSDASSVSLHLTRFQVPIYGTNTPQVKMVPLEERATYTWSEINVFTNISLPKMRFFRRKRKEPLARKQLLIDNSGVACAGELLAILGSSGAGKTTLLNSLTFRTTSTLTMTGIRRINGLPVNAKTLIRQSAYVQQDDLFIGNLTVKEHLIFQALVRMDREISYEQRMQRVKEVLSEFGLGKCENTLIGIPGKIKGISGGEQKRLSFAAEVLTNPKLMFCDEPTSGLDSFMAFNVVQVLKNMALTGKTIICTIHQPSSDIFSMFDKLLLMAEGRVAFLGSPQQADQFFTELLRKHATKSFWGHQLIIFSKVRNYEKV